MNSLLDRESALVVNHMRATSLGEIHTGGDGDGPRPGEAAGVVHDLSIAKINPVMAVRSPLHPQMIAA
jgi:hypothetical protein